MANSPTRELQPARKQRSFATFRAVMALILREMSTSYGRSPGGYIWAILQPAAMVAVMVVLFSSGLRMRTPALGTNFAIFFAAGIVPFLAYRDISGKLARSLPHSSALLVYPSVTLVDALVARFLLNALTQLLVGYVLFTGIMLLFETRTAPELPGIALSYAMVFALAVGVGTMNAFLTGMVPVWSHLWSIANRPLFLISGILFLYDDVPQPYRDWLWWNPLVHVVGQMRKAFYPYYDAPYLSPAYVFGLSLVLTVLGLLFLRRFALRILNDD